MNADQRRRLVALEFSVARVRPNGRAPEPVPASELTDQQAVDEWRRRCFGQLGGPVRLRPIDQAEEVEILTQWRVLARHESEVPA